MRINAVLGLADPAMIRAVRLAPLTESPNFGRISLRDIAVAEGEIEQPPDMARKPDPAMISAAFKDSKKDVMRPRLEALRAIAEDLAAIDRVFDERTPGQGPELAPVVRLVRKALARVSAALGEVAPAETAPVPPPPRPAPMRPARWRWRAAPLPRRRRCGRCLKI
jgi:type VI secretion system protein ImpA